MWQFGSLFGLLLPKVFKLLLPKVNVRVELHPTTSQRTTAEMGTLGDTAPLWIVAAILATAGVWLNAVHKEVKQPYMVRRHDRGETIADRSGRSIPCRPSKEISRRTVDRVGPKDHNAARTVRGSLSLSQLLLTMQICFEHTVQMGH